MVIYWAPLYFGGTVKRQNDKVAVVYVEKGILGGARSGPFNRSYCESSLEAAGALGAATLVLRSIPNPLGVRVGPGLGVVVIRSPFTDQIPILLSSAHGWY